MNQYSMQFIEPLIANIQESGRTVQVVFQCPISGHQVSSRASVQRSNSLSNQVKKSTERSILYAVQRAIGQAIRDAFGHNTFGRMASDITRQTVYSASSQMMNGLSKQEKESTIIEAFKKVERQFTWNADRKQWLSSSAIGELLSDFDQQKQKHPVVHPYDIQVLSRMMVEISMADGHMIQSEREWLMLFLNPEYGTLEQISQFPSLSSAELANCSVGGVRVTMMMIASAVAMCDEHLDQQELALLNTMAHGLGLSQTDSHNAKKWAQTYILEHAISYINQSVYGNLQAARTQILTIASKIGLSEQDALTIEAKVRRRQSNF